MRCCWIGLAVAALLSAPLAALAESYPARPVRLITPQTAGASMDILVRIVAPKLSELLTVDEAGVPGYEYNAWNGVFAPKGTPRAVIKKVHAALQKALSDPDVKQQYANQGLPPAGSESPEQFAAFMRADYDRIARLVKIAGIKPE